MGDVINFKRKNVLVIKKNKEAIPIEEQKILKIKESLQRINDLMEDLKRFTKVSEENTDK